MKFENTEVWGFEHAIRGMRNPLESWDKSDSYRNIDIYKIGKNDLQLCKRLINAGTEHRKFLRQIFVSVDIEAPLYFWKEFDTYKIGTTANSCSTMHKLVDKPITKDCFEMTNFNNCKLKGVLFDDLIKVGYNYAIHEIWKGLIDTLETLRQTYLETKDKRYWKELIRLLPESWLQKRTITLNYENVINMYKQRKNHKLTEWSKDFIEWCENLPYFKEFFLED